ncbi:sialidase-1 [Candidatus Halobonum tyrrellensis G22]|uniref:Sialidase-1 n=1 Tax=Candidatus Halobonum tyrrellensis G22 TaxID=1324957 RepID=V4GXQ5_9EURY|nr:sialidase-1 [Candidatus Halobonum tyrrellensis G22]
MALVAMLLVPGVALAGYTGSPDIEVFAPDNTLEPGAETTLAVQLTNAGDSRQVNFRSGAPSTPSADQQAQVTTARDLSVELESGSAPVDVKTNEIALGALQDGGVTDAEFRVSVHEDAEPGEYRLPIDISYRHVESVDYTGEVLDRDDVTEDEYVTIEITDSARFEIVNITTDAQVGGTGPVALTMENVGSAEASDATVTLQSMSGDVTFGQSASTSRYVGNWSADGRQTVRVQAAVASGALTEPYAVQASVQYDDEDGVTTESQPLSTGIVPEPEQEFSLDADESTLRVGREGNLSGSITNRGPSTAHDAVVVFSPSSQNVNAQETEFSLGTLEAGESAEFSVPVEVSQNSEPGQRQFAFQVQYLDSDDDQRQSSQLNVQADVQPQRDRFDVRLENETLEAGQTRTVTLLVTNNGEETLRNIDARAFTDNDLSLPSDTAFARQIGPGETTELVFELGAGADAIPDRTYSFNVDFQYETGGETQLSDTYSVPVDVTEPTDSGGLPWGIIGVVLVVVALVGGALWYRSRS